MQKLYANPHLYAGDFDNAEFADRIATLPLADQPATRWNYGHSTDVLGRVVEVASGQTLFQFEKQRLFDPLGMSETTYYVADEDEVAAHRPAISRRSFSTVAGIRDPTLPRRWESGGAGLVSTIGDYARFLQMLLNRGKLDGKRYLKPETVALMTSDQIGPETGIIHDPFYFPGPSSGFGLGFAVRTVAAAEYDMAARRISLGRRRRQLSILSIPWTTCSSSSWCIPRRRAGGSNWR